MRARFACDREKDGQKARKRKREREKKRERGETRVRVAGEKGARGLPFDPANANVYSRVIPTKV